MGHRHFVICLSIAGAAVGVLPSCARADDPTSSKGYILSIAERDQEHRSHLVANEVGISDVNSTLTITIDKGILREKLAERNLATLPKEAFARLQLLTDIVARKTAAITALHRALEGWDALTADPTGANLEAFQRQLAAAYGPIATIMDLAMSQPGSPMAIEIDEGLGADELQNYQVVFRAAAYEAARLRQLIDQHTTYVQFGANITTAEGTRPVHLEGFDTYVPGEPYEVTRWVSMRLTADEQEQLTLLADKAAELNRSRNAFLTYLKTEGTDKIVEGIANSRSLEQARLLAEESEAAAIELGADAERLRELVTKAKADVEKLVVALTAVGDKYRKGSGVYELTPAALLIETNKDLASVVDEMAGLIEALDSRARQFREEATRAVAESAGILRSLADRYEEAVRVIGDEAERWPKSLRRQIATALYGRAFDESAYALGEQVSKLSPNQMPDSTVLPLVTTGYREAGDSVLMAVRAGDATRTAPVVLERQQVTLYQVIPHTQRLVGLIFARTGQRYQAAPSYSYVWKGIFDTNRRRRSARYNQVWDPGIGVNVSVLDFDNDDSPEVGIGVTGTALRNWVQVGYGYNLQASEYFFFLGLQLGKGF